MTICFSHSSISLALLNLQLFKQPRTWTKWQPHNVSLRSILSHIINYCRQDRYEKTHELYILQEINNQHDSEPTMTSGLRSISPHLNVLFPGLLQQHTGSSLYQSAISLLHIFLFIHSFTHYVPHWTAFAIMLLHFARFLVLCNHQCILDK